MGIALDGRDPSTPDQQNSCSESALLQLCEASKILWEPIVPLLGLFQVVAQAPPAHRGRFAVSLEPRLSACRRGGRERSMGSEQRTGSPAMPSRVRQRESSSRGRAVQMSVLERRPTRIRVSLVERSRTSAHPHFTLAFAPSRLSIRVHRSLGRASVLSASTKSSTCAHLPRCSELGPQVRTWEQRGLVYKLAFVCYPSQELDMCVSYP
jgi:hypothetical protein